MRLLSVLSGRHEDYAGFKQIFHCFSQGYIRLRYGYYSLNNINRIVEVINFMYLVFRHL